MNHSGDFPGDMEEFPFDDRDTDAVFGASPGSESVPEELRDVADLVHAARRAGSADELVAEDVIVAQLAAAIGEHAASPSGDAHERIPVLTRFRTVKVAAAATAVLMLGATAAAAATGSLPGPVQSSVATGLSGVGISVPHHKAALAVEHLHHVAGPQAQTHKGPKHLDATHTRPKHAPIALGTVASVNGVSTAGTCGVSGATGAFTVTGHKGATFTVNVDPSTAFVDKGVTAPTFANVCVGDLALAKGTLAGMTVTATKVFVAPPPPPHVPTAAFGTVGSVNGVSDPGTCGVSGAAGTFVVTSPKGTTFTVNVDTSTAYLEVGMTAPTFANVCVGEFVLAQGTVADTTVTATKVFIAPVHHETKHEKHEKHAAFGTVASVNGVSDPGTCGTSGATGSFTLTGPKGTTFTVNVSPTTTFFVPGVTGASFANVCVGEQAGASGDTSGTTVTATKVFALVNHTDKDDDHNKSGDDDDHHLPKHATFAVHGPSGPHPTGGGHEGWDHHTNGKHGKH